MHGPVKKDNMADEGTAPSPSTPAQQIVLGIVGLVLFVFAVYGVIRMFGKGKR